VNNNNEELLQEEVRIGAKAEIAWNQFMKEYTEQKQIELYTEFLDASIDQCHLVKFKQIALDEMVAGILSAIETGKLAKKQLGV